MMNILSQKIASIIRQHTATPSPPSGCAVPSYKGDNFCDNENNNAGCDWDGGDCCGNIDDMLASVWILLNKEVAECLSTKATAFAMMKTTMQVATMTEATVAVTLMIHIVMFANAWILPSNVSILTTIPIVQTGLLQDIAPSKFMPTG